MDTMQNLHRLEPCALCSVRMAVPSSALCTVCDAVTIRDLVPDDLASLWPITGEFRGTVS
jgi:hypothetical protein